MVGSMDEWMNVGKEMLAEARMNADDADEEDNEDKPAGTGNLCHRDSGTWIGQD